MIAQDQASASLHGNGNQPHQPTCWKVLIVDDEPTVHQITRFALQNFQFAGRGLDLISAYSAAEALSVLRSQSDIALLFLDVVMETPDAGLWLVRQVRDELENRAIRIILRTGQPGQAPERRVVTEYDINNYKEKTELTTTKLFTAVCSALRAYRDIRALEANRRGLETVIDATASIFGSRALGELAQGVLEQLTSLLYLAPDAVYCKTEGVASALRNGDMEIIAATGRFSPLVGKSTDQIDEPLTAGAIAAAVSSKTHVLWKGRVYAVYFRTASGHENVICVGCLEDVPLKITRLVDLFLRNVSVAFDNVHLYRQLTDEIAVRREAERREAILARLPGELPEPVIRIAATGQVLYANEPGRSILEAMGGELGQRLPGPWARHIAEVLVAGRRRDDEIIRCGRIYEVSFSPIREAGYVNVFGRDVTELRATLARLEQAAFQDPLTGLSNRLYFNKQLQHAVREAQRYRGLVGVLLVDLNHFKQLNDTWGHEVGDRALEAVAGRLQRLVRDADLVARLGGDEFGIILTRFASITTLQRLAERIIEVLSEPVELIGKSWPLTCSIGLTTFPTDAQSAEDLLRCADLAMYQVKRDLAPGYRFYDSGIHQRMRRRTEVELTLRDALARDRLEVHYQPLIALGNGAIIGAEALIRLRSEDGRLVPPGAFIDIAEDTGLIDPIGEWVLRRVCADVGAWAGEGLSVPRVAINVSARQFRNPSLTTSILSVLGEAQVAPSAFELEITESVLLGEEEAILTRLQELRDTGLTFTIDDFGTGYFSLSYLRRLPVDKLKIDRSFVADMLSSDDAAAIVDAIISLGQSLRLRVLAEGVEQPEQIDYLRSKGCEEGQGFYYFKPLPGADYKALLRRSSASA